MQTLATNYDGVPAMIAVTAWGVAAVLAAPFVVYYSVLASRNRGLRRSSWPVLAITGLFVLLAPVTFVLGVIFQHGDDLPYAALSLTMGLLPSIALGIALLFDAVSLWAMFAPTVGVVLGWLFLCFAGDWHWSPLGAPVIWHAAVFGALWFDGRPGWRSQRDRAICPRCGYDLKGLRTRLCPECGERPA